MPPTITQQLNDPALAAVFATHRDRLQALFDGATLDEPFFLRGIEAATEDAITDGWRGWLESALAALATHVERARDRRVFRPLILCYNPHGVHYVDELFGADVFYLEGGGWQVHPLDTPVGQLERPDIDANPYWQTVRAVALSFLEAEVGNVTLSLPTIASPLNIAVNLFGQEFLLAMSVDPEAARHDLAVIHSVQCELHQWFLDHLPPDRFQCIVGSERHQPPGFGQLCGCTTHLVSGRMYAEVIAPLDAALLALYPHGGMIHLCGSHRQHITTWRDMPTLRSVQLNDRAAEDMEAYIRGLREDQIVYVYPCEGMPVARVLDITRGHRTVIQGDIE